MTCAGIVLGYLALRMSARRRRHGRRRRCSRNPLLGAVVQLGADGAWSSCSPSGSAGCSAARGELWRRGARWWSGCNAMLVLIQVGAARRAGAGAAAGGAARDRRARSGRSGPTRTSSPSCTASRTRSMVLGAVVLTGDRAVLRHCDAARDPRARAAGGGLMYDVEAVRRDFPILAREVHGRPLVYLDNGASAQKPQAVIDAVTRAYSRGVRQRPPRPALPLEHRHREVRGDARHDRSASSARRARRRSSSPPARPWASTSSATPGRRRGCEAGDEIVLSVMEHHANIVPWHFLRERQGVVLKWVDIERRRLARPASGCSTRSGRAPGSSRSRTCRTCSAPSSTSRRSATAARERGRAGAGRRQPGGGAHGGRRAAPSAATSTRSPATSSTGRPARARSMPGASGWRRCGRSSAAAT